MTRNVRSELAKLLTVRSTFGIVAVAAGLAAVLSLAVTSVAGQGGNPAADDPQLVINVLSGAGLALVTALVAGVLVATGEYAHGTAAPTYLVSPRRRRVIAAKAVVAALFGVTLAVVALGATVGVGALVVSGKGGDLFAAFDADAWRMAGTLVLTGAFYGAAGVAVGALVRHQVGALAVAIGWSQIIETAIVPTFLPSVDAWLPAGLLASVGGAERGDLAAPAVALALVVVYGALLVVAAARRTARLDLA